MELMIRMGGIKHFGVKRSRKKRFSWNIKQNSIFIPPKFWVMKRAFQWEEIKSSFHWLGDQNPKTLIRF
jgi:hypothetical protein